MIKKINNEQLRVLLFFTIILIGTIITTQVVAADGINFEAPPGTTLKLPTGEDDTFTANMGNLLKFCQIGLNGVLGLGLLTSIIAFVKTAYMIVQGNARSRPEAMSNLTTIAITTACLGGFPLVFNLIVVVLTTL